MATLIDCGLGKSCYTTQGMADSVASEREKIVKHKLYSYFCNDCEAWHLTKMAQKKVNND